MQELRNKAWRIWQEVVRGMTVRFGLVGTAYWAADVHAPGLRAAEGVELVGIHGRSPEKLEAAARRNGTRAFARFEEMLDEVDAVSIAVSPDAQPAYAIQAARAGKHLLLEKPVALNVAAAASVAEAVAANGVRTLVFFVRRFVPEIAEAIDRERGKPWTRARIRVHAAGLIPSSPYRNSVWRQAQGAALWDIGPHALSVVLPMMGPVTEVRRLPAEADYVRFATRHAGGGESEISLSLRTPAESVEIIYEFSGPGGTIRLPEPDYDRPRVFSGAAAELARMIRSERRAHECDISLGLATVGVLQSVGGSFGWTSPGFGAGKGQDGR